MIPDKLALLVGPVHTRSAAFFFRGQPHQTISPEEVTVHVNMTDRCTIKAAMVMCKSAACRAAAEHSLEAFLWSDILQTKQLLQGSYWRTKLPLLINCPSAHTWCRTKQESIRLLKGLFSKNHSALLDWVCSPSLLLTSSVTDYWRLVYEPPDPAHLIPPTPPRSSPCSDEEGSRHAAQCGRPVTALSRVVMLQWWKHCFSWLCLCSREPELLSPAPSLTSHPRRPLTSRWAQTRITNGNRRLKEGDFYPIKLRSVKHLSRYRM